MTGNGWRIFLKTRHLQMISFTITEKGYSVSDADLEKDLNPGLIMGKVTVLLYKRFQIWKIPNYGSEHG